MVTGSTVLLAWVAMWGCGGGGSTVVSPPAPAPPGPTTNAQSFKNPLFNGGDPWVTLVNGNYYYSASGCGVATICVKTAKTLTGLASAPWVGVWNSPTSGPNSGDVWAPELHFVQGGWYIYYAGDAAGVNDTHRLFVLQADGVNPLGSYSMGNTGAPNGQLSESSNNWAIVPDVFVGADNQLYVVWSCTNFNTAKFPQATCLAGMSDPLHVNSNTVQISTPTRAWELRTAPIQEGPVGFTHNGRTYITYSASASWTDNDYAVGLLSNSDGKLLTAGSWSKAGPIFDHHGTAFGTGSVAFIASPDGSEMWNFYHGIDSLSCNPSYNCRDIRMQKMAWAADGSPLLGYPVNPGVVVTAPGGEAGVVGTGSALPDWGAAFGDAAVGNTAAGQVSGTWVASGAQTIAGQSLGSGWHQSFLATNPNLEEYTLSADLQWVQSGSTSTVPKYGLYALYSDANNNMSAWIDIGNKVVASYAVVGGAAQSWENCPLPAGFVPGNFNTLQVRTLGNVFTLTLNGAALSGACTGRTFNLLNGQAGVVTEDTQANYRNFVVRAG